MWNHIAIHIWSYCSPSLLRSRIFQLNSTLDSLFSAATQSCVQHASEQICAHKSDPKTIWGFSGDGKIDLKILDESNFWVFWSFCTFWPLPQFSIKSSTRVKCILWIHNCQATGNTSLGAAYRRLFCTVIYPSAEGFVTLIGSFLLRHSPFFPQFINCFLSSRMDIARSGAAAALYTGTLSHVITMSSFM